MQQKNDIKEKNIEKELKIFFEKALKNNDTL